MENEVQLIKKTSKKEEKKKNGLFFVLLRRNRVGRLSILLLLLLVTAICLGTSTYAWFTANFNVTVNSIEVNVATSAGISISTNGTDWKAYISNDDIKTLKAADIHNQIPSQMNPVSTVPTINSTTGYLTMYAGSLSMTSSGNKLSASESATISGDALTTGVGGDYVMFDFFIKSDFSSAQVLSITASSGIAETSDTLTGIVNSSRFALIYLGSNSASNLEAASLASNDTTTWSGTRTIKYFEPYYGSHYEYATTNYSDYYNKTGSTYVGAGTPTDGSSTSYPCYGLISPVSSVEIYSTDSSSFKQVNASGVTYRTSTDTSELDITSTSYIALSADRIGGTDGNAKYMNISKGISKYRVYVWIEGQDIDCHNSASGGKIQFNLGFSVPSA